MQIFVITLLTCSVTMSALALFYMAIMPLLAKRYSEKGRYYTWLIIIVGLIIPFRPQFNNAIVKVNVPGEAATPIVQVGNATPVTMPTPFENAAFPSFMQSISWWQITAVIWLIGMVVVIAYHAIRHYQFMKIVMRWNENISDEQTLTMFNYLKAEMGISKRIDIYSCSSVGSPMLIGLIRPRILLPVVNLAQDELRLILKHELIHYKRKDLYFKCLVLIATVIHWFNPIVYLIAKTIDVGRELSCDAEIVKNMGADTRQQYSEAIIGMVRYQSKLITALSTSFYGGKKGMRKRIFSIMDTTNKRAGFAIVCAALIVTMGTGFAFAANAGNSSNEEIGVVAGTANNSDDVDNLEYWKIDEFETWMEKERTVNQKRADISEISFYEKNEEEIYVARAWTQEDVDNLYSQWQYQLAQMKAGYKITKPIELENGGLLTGIFEPESLGTEIDTTPDDYKLPDVVREDNANSFGSVIITLPDGTKVGLGDFNNRKDAQDGLKAFLDIQVNDGKLSQQEADNLFTSYWDSH